MKDSPADFYLAAYLADLTKTGSNVSARKTARTAVIDVYNGLVAIKDCSPDKISAWKAAVERLNSQVEDEKNSV